ncbi:hypothetical protein B0T11DRAFT_330732 [Plectosphaerella cucumerina]|uniref:Uncharacterized protein n=1 Tax=Plectosphaerella cucumerina TaxID=40658 RepID=A0A8K0TGA5_9PEZI|nr:hypothetical protein B0T11DRAFT_330732 [Plectosphaerella cucumerina]
MSSSEYLSTSFIGGWVTVLAVAGAMGYQYYSKSQPAAKKEKPSAATSAPKKQNRAKKQRAEAYSSVAQKAVVEEAPAVPAPSSNPKKERDEESDNKAFAAQMANVKAGKKFDGKSNVDKKQKQKSVKQSRAAEPVAPKAEPEVAAAAPSNEEVEADVDSSSAAASPEVAAADPSGVSDMLEPTSSGPSVLRLTDTDKVKQKAKVVKAPEQVETKKQRQNRKKAEERKLAREEDEKERKILLEKQRRTAREAAGVAPKDGSQFTNAAVKSSAWTAGATNGTTPKKEETLDVQPLDTYETTTTSAPAASIAPAKPKDTSAWTSSLPSEEEQLEAAKAEDDAWNTVPTKANKKAKKTQSSENLVPSAPAKEARPAPAPLPVNGSSNKPAQSYGSFSALTVKDTAQDDDEDVEEKEWDV